ncbi:hypothetical protein BJX99DRAFT_45679 [Aspergillus californicus]
MARSGPAIKTPAIPSTPQPKRKRAASTNDDDSTIPVRKTRQRRAPAPKSAKVVDLTDDVHVTSPPKKASSKGKKAPTEPAPERRERRFRSSPPQTFQQRLQRAVTQRMFVVAQNATISTVDQTPELKFDIVGTTGNLYSTVIGKVPRCSCPDALKGNQCKHICYVLVKVLNAPVHLQYQLAFLSTELRDIYENSSLRQVKDKSEEAETDGKRKPVEGDCPICFMEFEPEKEDIVWCRAACGNNIHRTCFQKWAATQQAQGVRCVYCRAAWQFKDADGKVDINLEQLLSEGSVGADGYVNVASQMGLSGERDSSTYYQRWGRQRSYYSGWHSYGDE